jgi:elongation factor G
MNKPGNVGRLLIWTTLRPLQSDCDNLRRALAKLAEDDTTFSVDDEDVHGEVIIRARDELHLEVVCARLLREHHIRVKSRGPKIIYLETVRRTSVAEGKFITQSGGRGHYAHVVIRIEPNASKGYEFVDETPVGAIPKKFLEPVNRGVRYALKAGAIAGYETVDAMVTLCGGSYHEDDSDDAAFESAAFMALKEAMPHANPVLLEPVMFLELIVPQEFCGSVMGDLNSRRGCIEGMEDHTGNQAIRAFVPLAEIIGYATELRSITRGRASYSARFARYEHAPGLHPIEDDGTGVTANRPWKPKPRHGAETAEPPY